MDYSKIGLQHNSISMIELSKNREKCPVDFVSIIQKSGYNICDIDTVEWDTIPDGQVTKISINFITNTKKYKKR